jgi:COP9 signalosome complex subunit 7
MFIYCFNIVLYYVIRLFFVGTLQDYDQAEMCPLSPAARKKLLMLTLMSTCWGKRFVFYKDLMVLLHLESVREVEDVIISAIELELMKAKLDQKNVYHHL